MELNVSNPYILPYNGEPVDFILSPAKAARRKAENGNYCYWLKASDYNKFIKEGYDSVMYRDEIAVFSADVVKIIGKEHVKF